MSRYLFIVFVLAATGAGGAAGLVHFAVVPDFTGGVIGGLVGVGGTEAPKEKAPPRADPFYIRVEPVMVPIIQDGELKRNVYIAIRLEATAQTRKKVMDVLGRLHDSYLQTLFSLVQEQQKDTDTLDLEPIRNHLMRATEQIIGPGIVKNIVFLSVFNR